MRFERHAFISYAHIDNRPLPTEKDGWVTLFHEALQQLLAGRLGGNADVWRDDKLRGNDIFSDEILAQFPKTAAVVTVVSPRYLKSEWCTREIGEFCSMAERTGGVVVGNKSRVFKVLKLPSEGPNVLPPVMSQVLGYEFYELDDDKTPRELDPAYGEKSKQDFLRRVARLAWDIKLLVERLEAATAGPVAGAAAPAPRPTVYLAECGRDRRDAREMLEAELTRLGYTVLPDKELPRDEVDYVAEVDRLLVQSQFSIHLVGGAAGLVPDGPSQKSVVVLQNERAVQRSRTASLPRLIWLPDGTSSGHPAQAAFISALHRDAEVQFGADLITGDLETLKGAAHAALKKIQQAEPLRPSAPASVTSSRTRVHVLCDERDRKEAIVLLRALKERTEVSLPIFTGDAAKVREANQELLVGCDAVILYYGAGDETWRFHQQNELKRIRAIRTDRALPTEIIYLGGPRTDDKEVLAAIDKQNIIDALSGFPEVAVAAFLTRMVPSTPAS